LARSSRWDAPHRPHRRHQPMLANRVANNLSRSAQCCVIALAVLSLLPAQSSPTCRCCRR
jgi:hypothetical protein